MVRYLSIIILSIFYGGEFMGKVIKLFLGKDEKTMPTIFEIAQAFLSFESMSHKKLQKLCYYAQAYHLAVNSEPLMDCKFQAWKHGPVCPELYQDYKTYGYFNIPRVKMPLTIEKNKYVKSFLKDIYDIFGDMSADELEDMTHREEPWMIARGSLEEWENSGNEISNKIMENYYSKYLEE